MEFTVPGIVEGIWVSLNVKTDYFEYDALVLPEYKVISAEQNPNVQVTLDGVAVENGYILSCHAKVTEDISILISKENIVQSTKKTQHAKGGLAVALDVGTTTLAAALIDLNTNCTLSECSCLNPQGVYGADVLTRITAAKDGKLELLQKLILDKTREMISNLAGDAVLDKLYVCASVEFLMTVADFFIKAVPQSPENMTKESQIPLKQTALAKIKMEKG